MAVMGEPWETKTTGIRLEAGFGAGAGAEAGMGASFAELHAANPETLPATASFRTSRRDRSIPIYNPGTAPDYFITIV